MTAITTYIRTSKAPLPFEALYPGSLFTIHAERSRGMAFSKDKTVYRKARDGYYSQNAADPSRAIVLYPEDLVWPIAIKR